ncbi:hypothetical protein ACFSNO_23685 [Streptomyces cirratus]
MNSAWGVFSSESAPWPPRLGLGVAGTTNLPSVRDAAGALVAALNERLRPARS